MTNYLTEMGETMLAINIVGLVLILYLKQAKTAFEVVLFAAVTLGLFHLGWEYYLKSLFGRPDLKLHVRIGWYLGFSATYFLCVGWCAFHCRKNNSI